MLTTELSSHQDLLAACGKTSHRAWHSAAQPTLAHAPRQQSLPCSEIGFVSKLQIHRSALVRGTCTILHKSPIGFVFSTPGPSVLCAQVCTNMHKSAQSPRESDPANSNNSLPVIKNWLRSAKTVRPNSGKHFGPRELSVRYQVNSSSVRPAATGPYFVELFEI